MNKCQSAIEGAEAKLTRAEGTKGSDMKALAKLEADLQKKEGEVCDYPFIHSS